MAGAVQSSVKHGKGAVLLLLMMQMKAMATSSTYIMLAFPAFATCTEGKQQALQPDSAEDVASGTFPMPCLRKSDMNAAISACCANMKSVFSGHEHLSSVRLHIMKLKSVLVLTEASFNQSPELLILCRKRQDTPPAVGALTDFCGSSVLPSPARPSQFSKSPAAEGSLTLSTRAQIPSSAGLVCQLVLRSFFQFISGTTCRAGSPYDTFAPAKCRPRLLRLPNFRLGTSMIWRSAPGPCLQGLEPWSSYHANSQHESHVRGEHSPSTADLHDSRSSQRLVVVTVVRQAI